MSVAEIDWQPRTRLIFGAGRLVRLGDLAREIGGKRALLVTDPGVRAAGYADTAGERLETAGVVVSVFDEVPENPTSATVERCAEAARAFAPDLLIGLGGGSAMDTARGGNFLYTNGGAMPDYRGYGKAEKPMLPLIAVPTTAGTGSEMQSYAVISDAETHRKMACGDPKAAARAALLDPELTLTCPRRVTACAGIDAIAHAVETAVTTKGTALSRLFSREAFRLLAANFRRVLDAPDDLDARGAMLLGAAYAGSAIENSMLGAAHSAANPLTARSKIVHGQAVGMMLPYVVAFNASEPEIAAAYETWVRQSGPPIGEPAVDSLIEFLRGCLMAAGFPSTLREAGVTEEAIPLLAKEAAEQWTVQFNPRPIGEEDFVALYRDALHGVPPAIRR
ncbi:MAG: iron-containing alcohol dehydrogenase [Capsulimonadales bacterium]|nr:iron-containing alcohol dehydrogenase [Capsulimonadales bacterium]